MLLRKDRGRYVATIRPEASVRDLLDRLVTDRVGALVVSSDGRTIVGIVSERDVVRGLHAQGAPLLGLPVESIMTPGDEVKVTTEAASVEEMMRLMTEERIRHVPVVSEDRLVGIVSIGDVVKSRMDLLIEYITSG